MGERKIIVDSIIITEDEIRIKAGSTHLICDDRDKIDRMLEVLDIKVER